MTSLSFSLLLLLLCLSAVFLSSSKICTSHFILKFVLSASSKRRHLRWCFLSVKEMKKRNLAFTYETWRRELLILFSLLLLLSSLALSLPLFLSVSFSLFRSIYTYMSPKRLSTCQLFVFSKCNFNRKNCNLGSDCHRKDSSSATERKLWDQSLQSRVVHPVFFKTNAVFRCACKIFPGEACTRYLVLLIKLLSIVFQKKSRSMAMMRSRVLYLVEKQEIVLEDIPFLLPWNLKSDIWWQKNRASRHLTRHVGQDTAAWGHCSSLLELTSGCTDKNFEQRAYF